MNAPPLFYTCRHPCWANLLVFLFIIYIINLSWTNQTQIEQVLASVFASSLCFGARWQKIADKVWTTNATYNATYLLKTNFKSQKYPISKEFFSTSYISLERKNFTDFKKTKERFKILKKFSKFIFEFWRLERLRDCVLNCRRRTPFAEIQRVTKGAKKTNYFFSCKFAKLNFAIKFIVKRISGS